MTPTLPPAPGAAGPAGTLALLAAALALGPRPARERREEIPIWFPGQRAEQPCSWSSSGTGVAAAGCPGVPRFVHGPQGREQLLHQPVNRSETFPTSLLQTNWLGSCFPELLLNLSQRKGLRWRWTRTILEGNKVSHRQGQHTTKAPFGDQ